MPLQCFGPERAVSSSLCARVPALSLCRHQRAPQRKWPLVCVVVNRMFVWEQCRFSESSPRFSAGCLTRRRRRVKGGTSSWITATASWATAAAATRMTEDRNHHHRGRRGRSTLLRDHQGERERVEMEEFRYPNRMSCSDRCPSPLSSTTLWINRSTGRAASSKPRRRWGLAFHPTHGKHVTGTMSALFIIYNQTVKNKPVCPLCTIIFTLLSFCGRFRPKIDLY